MFIKPFKNKPKIQKKQPQHSKKLVDDVRALLWAVTIGGLVLAAFCIYKGFLGSLPWLSAMVGLPWTAHGVICSFYLNMAKSDHREGGITFETAKANGFVDHESTQCSTNNFYVISNPKNPMI